MQNQNYFYLLFLCVLLSCAKEQSIIPNTLVDVPSPEPFIEYPIAPSCIPYIPITPDTSISWLGFPENPYRGAQEFGKAEAYIKEYNYYWEASAAAYRGGNVIRIGLSTVFNEQEPYRRIELLQFWVSIYAERCTPLENKLQANTTSSTSHSAYHIGDGDVNFHDYYPLSNGYNTIEITALDTLTNRISGNFIIDLAIEDPDTLPFVPDTLHFVNGSFSCAIL